jgi:transposase
MRQAIGRSRGGATSKIHAVVDTNGLPVPLALTASEAHDARLAGKLLSRLKSGTMLLADPGYDADRIRALSLRSQSSSPQKSARRGRTGGRSVRAQRGRGSDQEAEGGTASGEL